MESRYGDLQTIDIEDLGDPGFQRGRQHVGPNTTQQRNRRTMHEFYAYTTCVRRDTALIHHGQKLFQQYLVDNYVKSRQQRLEWTSIKA